MRDHGSAIPSNEQNFHPHEVDVDLDEIDEPANDNEVTLLQDGDLEEVEDLTHEAQEVSPPPLPSQENRQEFFLNDLDIEEVDETPLDRSSIKIPDIALTTDNNDRNRPHSINALDAHTFVQPSETQNDPYKNLEEGMPDTFKTLASAYSVDLQTDGSIPSGFLGKNKRKVEELLAKNPNFAKVYNYLKFFEERRQQALPTSKAKGFLGRWGERLGFATALGTAAIAGKVLENNYQKTESEKAAKTMQQLLPDTQSPLTQDGTVEYSVTPEYSFDWNDPTVQTLLRASSDAPQKRDVNKFVSLTTMKKDGGVYAILKNKSTGVSRGLFSKDGKRVEVPVQTVQNAIEMHNIKSSIDMRSFGSQPNSIDAVPSIEESSLKRPLPESKSTVAKVQTSEFPVTNNPSVNTQNVSPGSLLKLPNMPGESTAAQRAPVFENIQKTPQDIKQRFWKGKNSTDIAQK